MKLFGVFFLMLSYPLFSMLWRHQYPVASAEIALLVIVVALGSAALGGLAGRLSALLRNLIIGTFLCLVFILQFDLVFEGLRFAVPAVLLLALVMRRNYVQLALAAVAALFIGAYFDALADRSSRQKLNPAAVSKDVSQTVVHILMDAFIGADGLPPQDVSQQLRKDVLAFFEDGGFEVYKKAYSHYHATQDSLSHAFQFRNDDASPAQLAELYRQDLAVTENRYFEILRESGFTLNVYQTDMVDFCSATPDAIYRCREFSTPNLKTIKTDVSNFATRARILVTTLFRQSELLWNALSGRGWLQPWNLSHYRPAVIDEMLADLEEDPARVFFAHLLLPHSPYAYGEGCQVDYSRPAWERASASSSDLPNTPNTRAVRYVRYLTQVRCAVSELQRLFDGMRNLGVFDEATIFVHGDHGSRISLSDAIAANAGQMTGEDYRDLFSTMFAIKSPGGQSNTSDEVVALETLLARTAQQVTGTWAPEVLAAAAPETKPFIYLSKQIPLQKVEINIFELD